MTRTIWIATLLAAGAFPGGCGEEGAEENAGGDTIDVVTGQETEGAGEALDPAENSAEAWLAGRYGPESGMVELEVSSGGETTRQVRYWRDHGRTEALYWYAFGENSPPHMTVIRGDSVYFRGPADSAVQVRAWDPSLPIAMPNFQRLNDAMRQKYGGLRQLEGREVFGYPTDGHELRSGQVVSRVWEHDGVMLHGEIDGIPAQKIEPMTVTATNVALEIDVPDEKFELK